jgi:hypothetical protein
LPESGAATRALRKKWQKKSAQFGRFFFFALPCIVEENFTGDLLEIAAPRPQISRTSPTND